MTIESMYKIFHIVIDDNVKNLMYLICNFIYLRIRPQIPREVIDMCHVCTTVTQGEPQVRLGSDKFFTYDYVFDTEETQEAVYDVCVKPLVQSALEG